VLNSYVIFSFIVLGLMMGPYMPFSKMRGLDNGYFKFLSDRCFCRNAIFARAAGAKEKDERVLFIEKRMLQGNEPSVTITVNEKPFDVGVDPYNKMIDRVSNDNRKEVSID
jgi:hypothetical protein